MIRAAHNFLRGCLIGAADTVPGFSGGTVALLLGIYERLVIFLSGFAGFLASLLSPPFKNTGKNTGKNTDKGTDKNTGISRSLKKPSLAQLKKLEWSFILALVLGIGTAVFSLAQLLEILLEDYPEEIAGLFSGMAVAAVIFLFAGISDRGFSAYFLFAATGGLSFWLLGFQSMPSANPEAVLFLAGGAAAAIAMILPGISGAFVLLMMGMYGPAIGAVSDFEIGNLLLLLGGFLSSLLVFSTFLNFLLKRFRSYLLVILAGLLAGSMRVLWPWPNGVGIIDSEYENVVDGTSLDLPSLGDFWLPFLLAAAGFAAAGFLFTLQVLKKGSLFLSFD